ncbi:MAG: molybdopterin cofactor-binding domain-containing protein [Planctomycetota bacterium]
MSLLLSWEAGSEERLTSTFFYDTFRPAAAVKIKSGFDETGKIVLWDYTVHGMGGRGAKLFYNVPHNRTTLHRELRNGEKQHLVKTGPWRAPDNNTNSFARESHIDVMAVRAGIDPLEFRLKNINDEKFQAVLMAGEQTGSVQVKRVVCAQDLGLVINPEGVALQTEGCITMGMGYALTEEVHHSDGKVRDLSFATYELPRFSWVPEIEMVLIEADDEPSKGAGEPAIICMGGVLANAVYDAIGSRVFQIPMTPERIKQAIAARA